jgi:hypothetical protein
MFRFKRFFRRLKRSTSWFFFMWRNEEFDYIYLYEVLEKKLGEMENCIRNGYALHSQTYGRMIKLIRKNINIILDDDPCPNLDKQFKERYGDMAINTNNNKLSFIFSKCNTDEQNKHANEIDKLLSYVKIKELEKTKFKIFNALGRWIDYFWD